MGASTFWSLVFASASSMLVLVLICFVGAAAAIYPRFPRPMLGPHTRRDVGYLTVMLGIPCVAIASIGSSIHAKEISEVWDIWIWSVLSIVGAGLLGAAVSRSFLSLGNEEEASFILASAYGNSFALPILMMTTLCNSEVILDRMVDSESCITTSYSYLLIYVSFFNFSLYGVSAPLLQRLVLTNRSKTARESHSRDRSTSRTPQRSPHPLSVMKEVPTHLPHRALGNGERVCDLPSANPMDISAEATNSSPAPSDMMVSTSRAAAPQAEIEDVFARRMEELLFGIHQLPESTDSNIEIPSSNLETPNPPSTETLNKPVTVESKDDDDLEVGFQGEAAAAAAPAPMLPKVAEGAEAEIPRPDVALEGVLSPDLAPRVHDQSRDEGLLVALRRALFTPPVAAPFVALLVGICEPVSDALFRGSGPLRSGGVAISTLGSISVPLSVLLMAAALVHKPPAGSAPAASLSPSTVATLCVVRLALVPAAGIGVCYAAIQAGLFQTTPNGGLRALLIMIQMGAPSAQMVVVLMTMQQNHDLAQALAKAYLVMYPLSILTTTAWTSLALYLVESLIWSEM